MKEIIKLSDNTKTYLENYYSIIEQMAMDMRSVIPNDSISQTYIKQTLPLNNGIIKLNENILLFTTSIEIESLAKSLIQESEKNIENLSKIVEECASAKNNERDINLYFRRYTIIFDNMIRRLTNVKTENNLNYIFLSAMIPLLESSIEMAKNVLRYDICLGLKENIKQAILTQTIQVQLMKNLQRRNARI